MRVLFGALLLVASLGCTPAAREPLDRFQEASWRLVGDKQQLAREDMNAAFAFLLRAGIPEVSDIVARFKEAIEQSDESGGVLVSTGESRLYEKAYVGPPPKTWMVRIAPSLQGERLYYHLRINTTVYDRATDGPAVLGVYLFAAALRWSWFEDLRREQKLVGPAFLDAVIKGRDGPLAAHFATWEPLMDSVYLPLRAQGRLPAMSSLDEFQRDRTNCDPGWPRSECVQWAIRHLMSL